MEDWALIRHLHRNTAGFWMILDRLPEQTWHLPAWWRRQLARAFDDLALDVEAGRLPRPRCVAEEAALVIAVAGAPRPP